MKLSEQPANHILVKAYTNSEWDSCDFAIVSCDESWRERMTKRLDAVMSFRDATDFLSLNYWDGSAEFYADNDDKIVKVLPDGREWGFVELENGEEETFDTPENRLDCRKMVIYPGGCGRYQACGKHSGEEFYTVEFPIGEIIESIRNHKTSES
ncbi:MAG: hypothetical protein LBU98_03940 [Alistipes sp.]|jgi:hypothetical protein|nr:hypothetical protein [Alistipes sp.]